MPLRPHVLILLAATLAAPAGIGSSRVLAATSPTSTTSTTPTTTIDPSTTVPESSTTTPATSVPGSSTTTPVTTTPATTTPSATSTTTPVATTPVTTTTTTLPGSTTTSTTTTTLPPCPTTTTTAPPSIPVEPPPPAPGLGVVIPADLADILLTIRLVESGERYEVPPNRGNASGAYQYIASTWNGYAGYPHAYLAPPPVQDERALADVRAILTAWKGDVSMVPVIWYYPRAAREPALMDVVPVPGAGNRLTVREYQHRWLDVLAFVTGTPARYGATAILPELRHLAGHPPTPAADQDDELEIVFPALGRAVVAPPADCAECEGADAVVFGQRMQPVLAAADGVVTARQVDDARSGAVTMTITSADGHTFHYAGFNDDRPDTDDGAAPEHLRLSSLATIGGTVRAGQIIGFMGDTDPMPGQEHLAADAQPVWPHLRLTITDPEGHRIDADHLVAAAQRRQACHVGIGPWSLPEADDDVDRERVDVSALLDGGWTLHRDGTVTAVGRAALIVPPQDCVWAPAEPFGPGAEGERTPDDWDEPLRVNARFWVAALTSAGESTGPLGPLAAMRP